MLESDAESISTNHGPLFHRWLPNGESDAITLEIETQNAMLNVWFDRLGYTDGNSVIFDSQRREVDVQIMNMQGVLDAGPLHGLLQLQNLSEAELRAVRDNVTGDSNYISLGKRILKLIIYPSISRLLSILRINYGQYWVRSLEAWNLREQSLGHYFQGLNAKWSIDGRNWNVFIPDERVVSASVDLTDSYSFSKYLTKQDWNELRQILKTDYQPSQAAVLIGRAHQLLDQGRINYALVEGVTAIELAVGECIKNKTDSDLLNQIQAFWNLPLTTQITATAALIGVASEDLKHSLKAIKLRNALVHEGRHPPDDAGIYLLGLLKTATAFLVGPTFRFPIANPGNLILSSGAMN